jgi:hypothetical protein
MTYRATSWHDPQFEVRGSRIARRRGGALA